MNYVTSLEYLSIGDKFTLAGFPSEVLTLVGSHSATEVLAKDLINGEEYRLGTQTKVVKITGGWLFGGPETPPKPESLQFVSVRTFYPAQATLTTHEIARLITELDSVGQAEMLNELARISTRYVSTQLQSVADNQLLTDEARIFMKKVGEYSGIF